MIKPLTARQRQWAITAIKTFYGLPPHDRWTNTACGDGYFAKTIPLYGRASIEALAKELGLILPGTAQCPLEED